jgi:hypothetical protein
LKGEFHIKAPPELVECDGDDAAIEQARQLLDGKAIEAWRPTRLVVRLSPEPGRSRTKK